MKYFILCQQSLAHLPHILSGRQKWFKMVQKYISFNWDHFSLRSNLSNKHLFVAEHAHMFSHMPNMPTCCFSPGQGWKASFCLCLLPLIPRKAAPSIPTHSLWSLSCYLSVMDFEGKKILARKEMCLLGRSAHSCHWQDSQLTHNLSDLASARSGGLESLSQCRFSQSASCLKAPLSW